MKRIIFLLACVPSLAHATTVQKCVALDANGDYANSISGSSNRLSPDWSLTFSNVVIKGVAFCGTTDGDGTGSVAESVKGYTGTQDSITYKNTDCWCKMISPAVSGNWVFAYSFHDTNECWYECASECRGYFKSNATFRSAMFSNLSD